MISFNEAHVQLMAAKSQVRFVGVTEVQQLAKLLEPHEQMVASVKCWHNNSVALVCVTSKRLLIIDTSRGKKRISFVPHHDIKTVRHSTHYTHDSIVVYMHQGRLVFYAWRKKYAYELLEKLLQHVEQSRRIHAKKQTYAVPLGIALLPRVMQP